MKCLNCGSETENYLCPDCCTEEVLANIFPQILYFKAEICENPYLMEYAAALTEEQSVRNSIPPVLSLFSNDISEYYWCLYYRAEIKEEFEPAAIQYLSTHEWMDEKSQRLIVYLLMHYVPNDFIKPRAWCEWIAEAEGVCCELCAKAAEYFAMIAKYDLSDRMVEKGLLSNRFLYSDKEKMQISLEKQREKAQGYRTKKPYWPKTEERRRAVAMFYDEKGISYPRIESKPVKVPEDEFSPINECFDEPESYCAFWCAEAFSVAAAKPIYQIAAAKVEDGKIIDTFLSFVRPWDGVAGRKSAAKEAGVPLAVIESAEDVDQVMVKFCDFVKDAVLVSTGALGNQANLLRRAARYAGMRQLPNELYDLLDLAAETDSQFDFENNNRAYLLQFFGIAEGTDALGKAKANVALYDALRNYGV